MKIRFRRKFAVILLAVIMIASLASCGDPLVFGGFTTEVKTSPESPSRESEPPIYESSSNIGVTDESGGWQESADHTAGQESDPFGGPESKDVYPQYTPVPTFPTTIETETVEIVIPPNIPDLDIGREMTVFVAELDTKEWLDEDNGEMFYCELYFRKPRAEMERGIPELNVEKVEGSNLANKAAIIEAIREKQTSSDPNLIADLCSTHGNIAGSLVLEGVYRNINDSDYIDLSNPWWPGDIVENSAIDGRVYMVTGDISPSLFYETFTVFYNRDRTDEAGLEDPEKLVIDGSWTFDKLISMTKDVYGDLDMDTTVNENDFFGFGIADGAHLQALPFGMGIRVVDTDEDEGYVMAESYRGIFERVDSSVPNIRVIYEKFVAWMDTRDAATPYEISDFASVFGRGNAMFMLGSLGHAAEFTEIDYGILPCPKFDGNQENYCSYYGNAASYWGIPTNADIDDSAALMEYLGADSYTYITPGFVGGVMKPDRDNADRVEQMFELIRKCYVYDVSKPFAAHLTGYSQFTNMQGGGTSWGDLGNSFAYKLMTAEIKSIASTIRSLPTVYTVFEN